MKLTDQALRNALASGAIVPPPGDLPRRRGLSWGEKTALATILAGLCALGAAYGLLAG